jgi:hypothetical protein
MTAVGSRLQLRCFLEGVEVPVVSAAIMSQKNAAATCALQLPANDYLLDLKQRTLVHLYQYDGYQGVPPEQAVYVGGKGISIKQKILTDPDKSSGLGTPVSVASKSATEADLANDNYKLIFGGEVVGVQYMKTPSSRGITLQCIDWSSYWDIAYQYMVDGFSLGGGGLKGAFTGANTTVFNDFLKGSGDIVKELLSQAPRSYPGLKGTLLGGLMHLIEAIGGCYYGSRSIRGVNDFFSLAEMRLHLTQMVGANPASAKDELRLLSANGFGSIFSKTLGGLGKMVTVRQILLALQRYIFHEIVPITAPRFVPSDADPTVADRDSIPLSADKATASLVKTAEVLRARALEVISRQEASVDLVAIEGQSNARGGLQREFAALAKQAAGAYKQARKVALGTAGGMAQVASYFETTMGLFLSLTTACRGEPDRDVLFPLAGTPRADRVINTAKSISEYMQQVLEAKFLRFRKSTGAQPDPPPRLITQIYRPDVWMVAPPRCNVLFPELYSSFNYGRNFLGEVTRIMLRTHEAFFGSDILFDGFYMAPSAALGARSAKAIGQGRVGKVPDLSDAPAWVLKDMMDHELFTGIVPAFERMSDLNLHALRGGSFEYQGHKVGYAQLACNHIFYQYRFRTRSLVASGKFNPYAVLGFPMVIIDKYLAEDALRGPYDPAIASRMASSFANVPADERGNIREVDASRVQQIATDIAIERSATHYLGTPAVISHSISATAGGNTTYQMEYARTTSERTEFLGDNIGKAAKARQKGTARVPTVVAAFEAPTLGSTGIRGGKIVKVTDVTRQYQRAQPAKAPPGAKPARFASSSLVPLFVGERSYVGRKRQGTRVPVGVKLPATAYGGEVTALVGSGGVDIATDGDVLVEFKAYRIVEEIGTYAVDKTEIPPEELVFPPWYGSQYRTNQIGGLYSYYFGVGAITDPTVVLGGSRPKKFGDGDGRELTLDLQSVFDAVLDDDSELPPVGLSDHSAVPGDAVAGAPGKGASQDTAVLGEVQARSPIKKAIDDLVRIYSATRTQHYDTPAFVNNYTYRPIASMVDLFGTSDLRISDTGLVTQGREGFHSRAFGSYDDLRTLVAGGAGMPQTILGLKTNKGELASDETSSQAEVAKRLDTRKEKQLAVFRYLAALSASRGVVLG